MSTNRKPPDQGATKKFLVECDGCFFEQPAEGRDEAAKIGNDHHHETGHEVVAVEMPPSTAFS